MSGSMVAAPAAGADGAGRDPRGGRWRSGSAAVLAERDAVQANLLELDGSFAKQVLEGAALTGQTRDRWAAASAALAPCGRPSWRTRPSSTGSPPSAPGAKRPARKDLPELSELLTGGCVQLPGAPVPLARRDLAAAAARRSPSPPPSAPCAARSPR